MTSLVEERAASLRRREMEFFRGRARRVLEGRWDASAEELREAIDETWPKQTDAFRDEVWAAALQVQQTERPTVELKPVLLGDGGITPPPREEKETRRPSDEDYWNGVLDGEPRPERGASKVVKKRSARPAEKEPQTPRVGLMERVREALVPILTADPLAGGSEARHRVEEALGCGPIADGSFRPQWERVRKELGITDRPRPPKRRGRKPPPPPAPPPPASPATQEKLVGWNDEVAAPGKTQIRSSRLTYWMGEKTVTIAAEITGSAFSATVEISGGGEGTQRVQLAIPRCEDPESICRRVLSAKGSSQ